MTVYGFFPGGDPRDFTPDMECSTPQEIALHKEDCAAWDLGDRPRRPGCEWADGKHIVRAPYGIGSYEFDEDCYVEGPED